MTAPHRPLHRERYLRLDIYVDGWNLCPAIEWRAEDDIQETRDLLEALCRAQAGCRDVGTFVQGFVVAVCKAWPDRAWFLEVEDAPGRWVQVYQPYGDRPAGVTFTPCRETQSGAIPIEITGKPCPIDTRRVQC